MRTAIRHTEPTGPRPGSSFGRIARAVAAPWHGATAASANDADIRLAPRAPDLDAQRLIAAARVQRGRAVGDLAVALLRAVRGRIARWFAPTARSDHR